MKNKRNILILISASMTILIFVGCSSTKSPTTMKPSITMKSSMNTAQANSTLMLRTFYSDILKALVTAKTITQTQSEIVLGELTRDVPQVKGKMNKLSALVKSLIITQAQSDIINQKIQEAMEKIKY